MIFRKARLPMSGFALYLILFAHAGLCADHPKPAREFNASVPDIYGTINAGPYGIKYLSANQLAVWFTDNTSGQLSKRDQLQPTDPWRMKVQIFDTASGSVRNLEWPTRKISNGIQAQADGTVIVLNGPLVRCLSPDLKEFGTVNLPETAKHRDERILSASPGGKAAWVFESADLIGLTRIDSTACKLTASLAMASSITSLSASDDLLVATDSTHIGIRSLDSTWRALYQPYGCCVGGADFANQSIVTAYRQERNLERGETKSSLLFFDLRGKLLAEDSLDKGYEPGPLISSNGGRFALAASLKPESSTEILKYRLLNAKYRLWLYDLKTLKRFAELDVSRNDAPLFAFGVSPDGRQIAVLVGSKISIYDIQLPR